MITDEICRTLKIYENEGARTIVIIVAYFILLSLSNYGTIKHN